MRYIISTGHLLNNGGRLIGIGYSGHDSGVNNPKMVDDPGIGPIPPGVYTIGDPLDPPDHLGPLAMPLTPASTNRMYDRSAFFIHGDNALLNHSASHGCIILSHEVRQAVADDDDDQLVVVATA